MKVQKQQDTFHSGKILNEPFHQIPLKQCQIQKEIKKIQNQLLSGLQLLDNCIVAYQKLSLEKIIVAQEKQERKQVYENIDEVVECIGINPEIKELAAEEVAGAIAESIDMSGDPNTIDQTLSDDEMINTNEQALDKENMNPEEEPTVLHQIKIGDLIEKTIDHVYNLNV